MPIDKYKRVQVGLKIDEIYPTVKGKCSCGCGKSLTGRRRRWATDKCQNEATSKYWVIYGAVDVIRGVLYRTKKNEKGHVFCDVCNNDVTFEKWEADHVIEVRHGGGGCTIDNFQICCMECHRAKTKRNFNKPEKTLSLF